jgi:hypothetical protein
VKLKRIITFTKDSRKKIRNQNNEDQIEKYNTINWNCRMKLKINKTLTKGLRNKIRNPKNEDQIGVYKVC